MKSAFRSETSLFRILEGISRDTGLQPEALAANLGLNLSTIKNHIRKLRQDRLLIPANGRREIRLNPDYGYLVGIDMGASHLHFALA
ncbi:MAG TPA: winged helix-turn-helix domain-containing protein, partial [Terriglobia bacterium]|nr:winged helix-turn-helix domain-containing protein [Terriglobia bacterium]